MRLGLVHSTENLPAPPRALTWKTCRREVHFLDEPFDTVTAETLVDAEAYRLLLEIVCGLQSPVLGETEIQSQFKVFTTEASYAGHDALSRICQRILRDAKYVRGTHLQGFGAHSYGALAIGHLRGSRLVVVGTGALAAEIVGAAPEDIAIDVWSRRPVAENAFQARPGIYTRLIADGHGDTSDECCTVVVAAPIDGPSLASITDRYRAIDRAVDLRAPRERTPWPDGTTLVTLDDIFAAAPSAEREGLEQIAAARHAIQALANTFVNRASLRPFGWDDLCA